MVEGGYREECVRSGEVDVAGYVNNNNNAVI